MRKDQEFRDIFRANLRVEMEMRGWTIRDLAKETGISVSSLVHYRNASWDVPLTKVYKIAITMGCPITNLVLPNDHEMLKKVMRGVPLNRFSL